MSKNLIERLRHHLSCYWKEGDVAPQLTSIELMLIEEAATELAAAQAERDKAVAALKHYLNAVAKREKEASAIINSLTADIHITLPFRNYTEMSLKDCYAKGIMDGVAALKSQINAAIDAAMGEKK